jgi:hypothetical protein
MICHTALAETVFRPEGIYQFWAVITVFLSLVNGETERIKVDAHDFVL